LLVQLVVGYTPKYPLVILLARKNSCLSISNHAIQFCFFPFGYWATVSVVVCDALVSVKQSLPQGEAHKLQQLDFRVS
jgi:hypothetical protein